jgi:hypothetical protein
MNIVKNTFCIFLNCIGYKISYGGMTVHDELKMKWSVQVVGYKGLG